MQQPAGVVVRPAIKHVPRSVVRDVHNEAPSVVAKCVCNPDRSPVGINHRDAAPTPTALTEIVSDYFPSTARGGFSLLSSSHGTDKVIWSWRSNVY